MKSLVDILEGFYDNVNNSINKEIYEWFKDHFLSINRRHEKNGQYSYSDITYIDDVTKAPEDDYRFLKDDAFGFKSASLFKKTWEYFDENTKTIPLNKKNFIEVLELNPHQTDIIITRKKRGSEYEILFTDGTGKTKDYVELLYKFTTKDKRLELISRRTVDANGKLVK